MYVVSRKQAGNDRSPRQPSAPNNLPTQVTPLIGREQEARAACDMLAEPTLRLLTVTGPPGIGKTRLALCVASMAGPQFPHGIYFVPLSTVSDPALVVPSIAGVFGLKEGSASTLRDHLVMHLRDRKMLLLLDNFEQVSGAAPVLAELLEDAPDLKALVTSRTVLHIYGERSFPVPPLKVPEADTEWATETPPPIGADEVAAYEAVALFVQRARTVKPDFELTPSNAPVVAEICRRLEGVPLSIELAAARMRVLTPRAILERLSEPLLLLRGGPHNLPARQQTLNDAIAWSYTLLDEDEQRLFRRLSVFVGGCTLEAIENVVVDVEGTAYAATRDTGRRMPAERGCLDLVESLLGKSLLQPEEVAGEPRFAMLDTICEYARERLEETDEVDIIRGAHAAYYARLAEQVATKLEGPEQADWIERLEADRGNLRAALKWFAASPGEGHAVTGLRMAHALWRYWEVRGHLSEGRGWLTAMLDLAGTQGRTLERAKALISTARLSLLQGDNNHARSLYEESLAICRELNDEHGMSFALTGLAHSATAEGNHNAALPLYEQALEIRRRLGRKTWIIHSIISLADLVSYRGDHERAETLVKEGVALARELGDQVIIGRLHICQGHIARRQGKHDAAAVQFTRGLNIYRRMRSRQGSAECLAGLAQIENDRGRNRQATLLYAAAYALFEWMGLRWDLTFHSECQRTVDELRNLLPEDEFERLWSRGGALTPEQAVAADAEAEALPVDETGEPANITPINAGTRVRYPGGLTRREVDVLRLVAQGLTNAQVAEHLVISPYTVNMHLRSIYNKLGVTSRSAATRVAIVNELV